MITKKGMVPFIIFVLLIIIITALIIPALGFQSIDNTTYHKAVKLTKATVIYSGDEREIALPYNLNKLKPRTLVNVIFNLAAENEQYIYVKSVYAPLKIYADEKLIYKYGEDGSYPSYMQDPATNVDIIPLSDYIHTDNDTINSISLRFEYLSPTARDVLTIHPPIVGTEQEILSLLFKEMGFSFIFSTILLVLGILLILIAIFVTSFEKKGVIFLWLGLFALSVGVWGFGECNLTILLIHNPSLLYILAFTGLMVFPLPLMSFMITVVAYKNIKPLFIAGLIEGLTAAIALLLQFVGIIALSKSMYVFHIMIPCYLCFISLYTLFEWIKKHNNTAKRFLFPIVVLAVFSILELLNYTIRFTNVISMFFQIGILFFIVADCIIGGLFIQDSLRLRNEKQRLQFEVSTMEHRVQEEQKHNELVLQKSQEIKRQRHDLRHQLAVIKGLNENNNNKKLAEYLDSLVMQIPIDNEAYYCENEAVNAIISHYASMANKYNIKLSIKLVVPENTINISDSNLCIVFGNLLENAIEACNRMNSSNNIISDRYIKLSSTIQYDNLTITMDNSFDGKYICENGKFRSSKRNDFGVGLNSVLSIAEKHGGNAMFEANETVFRSSVYFRI